MRIELTNLYPFYKQYHKDIESGVAEDQAKAILIQSKAWKDYMAKRELLVDEQRADNMALLQGYYKSRGVKPWSPLD